MFKPPNPDRCVQRKGIEVIDVPEGDWRALSRGRGGERATLQLQLRVVADAGFVGLPNAGKSSLLRCMTRAAPAVAAYPFTTLMPNLGVLTAGAAAERRRAAELQGGAAQLADAHGSSAGAASELAHALQHDASAPFADPAAAWTAQPPTSTAAAPAGAARTFSHDAAPGAGVAAPAQLPEEPQGVLVDLPGLIEGAHSGRGLGRMFLRHLARTHLVVHVVDASAQAPAADFWAVREELRLYNPAYCRRPCVVALNKLDLPDAAELRVRLHISLHLYKRFRCRAMSLFAMSMLDVWWKLQRTPLAP